MNNNAAISSLNAKNKLLALLKSAFFIMTLTVVFGLLSYLLIQVNNAVFQLSISESIWCGLAMALVTVYYFYKKNFKSDAHNQMVDQNKRHTKDSDVPVR